MAEADAGPHVLAVHRVLDADHPHPIHGRMFRQGLLHLLGADVGAVVHDDVFAAAAEPEEAVGVDAHVVAAVQPAIRDGAGLHIGQPFAVEHQGRGAAHHQRMVDLGRHVAVVERCEHQAAAQAGQVVDDQLHPVGDQGGEPIAPPQTQPLVGPGQPLHLTIELGPAEAVVQILQGRCRRIAPQAGLHEAGQVDQWGQGRAVMGHAMPQARPLWQRVLVGGLHGGRPSPMDVRHLRRREDGG